MAGLCFQRRADDRVPEHMMACCGAKETVDSISQADPNEIQERETEN